MLSKKFWARMVIMALAMALSFGMTLIGCGDDSTNGGDDGTLTVTGISSEYDGKYAVFYAEAEEAMIVGAASVTLTDDGSSAAGGSGDQGDDGGPDISGTAVKIANGRVSLPMWTLTESGTKRYSGNDTVEAGIFMIFNSAAVSNGESGTEPIYQIEVESITFKNGSATIGLSQDSALNGEWDGPVHLVLNNGSLTYGEGENAFMKGTYTAKGGVITIQVTQVYGDALTGEIEGLTLESKWYTKDELRAAIKSSFGETINDGQIDEMLNGNIFVSGTGTYTVSGDTLTIQGDWFEEESVSFTQVTGDNNIGKLTVTGIPSEHNGKYVVLMAESGNMESGGFFLLGAQSVTSAGAATLVRITNGTVRLSLYKATMPAENYIIENYSGTATLSGEVSIYETDTIIAGGGDSPIARKRFTSIQFTNGVASINWANGTDIENGDGD